MRKVRVLVLALLLSALTSNIASADGTCSQLNVPGLADDNLTITVTAMTTTEKTGSFLFTINYKMSNGTSDKKIDEGSFKIFYTDGTSEPQYGFFGTLFPGDSKERSHTWEHLKSKTPMSVSYNAGFFSSAPSPLKLNWAPPGQICSLVSPAAKAAADKGSAGGAGAADAANAAVDAAAEATDAANAATDAALGAADAANAATASAEDASAAATSVGADLTKISTQIEKLDVALKNATTSLASVTTAYENARVQVTKSQASLNASTNASEKLPLSSALSKLANAVLILSSSKSKLSAQVNVLGARKSSLLNVEKQLMGKMNDGKISKPSSAKPVVKEKVIICVKGKSSLKVIGKNPKCPARYKAKK